MLLAVRNKGKNEKLKIGKFWKYLLKINDNLIIIGKIFYRTPQNAVKKVENVIFRVKKSRF